MTAGSLVTSRGVPRAISRPWWNTTTRSASETITSMMCSTMTMVMPVPWMRRTRSIASRTSVGVRPAMASSSSKARGSEASARAISRRLRPGVPRLLAGVSASRASPTFSSTSRALARASAVLGWRSSAPMVALSSADMDSKVSGTWKLRARPSLARASGGSCVTSTSPNITVPEVADRSPVRQLKKVDLPAPLGPIRPTISPSPTSTEASFTALKAPKALTMLRASISMATHRVGGFGRQNGLGREQRQQAARQEARDDDDDGAIDDKSKPRPPVAQVAVGEFLQRHQDERADQRAEQMACTAEGRHHQHLHRDQDAEARFRIDEAVHGEIKRARERGEGAAQHVGVELVAAGRHKLYAYMLSGAFASLAGSLYFTMYGFVDPESGFGILISVKMLVMAALGGAGHLFGPLIGALILVPLEELSNSYLGNKGAGLTFVVYGAIIIFIARFLPSGLLSLFAAKPILP